MNDYVPLPDMLIEPIVRHALAEDLGRAGDLTTAATIPPDLRGTVALVSRQHGVVAGLRPAAMAWQLLDDGVEVDVVLPDGTAARREEGGEVVFHLSPQRAIASYFLRLPILLAILVIIAGQTIHLLPWAWARYVLGLYGAVWLLGFYQTFRRRSPGAARWTAPSSMSAATTRQNWWPM